MTTYHLPGEFMYEGAVYFESLTTPEMLDAIREFPLTPDDVIITSYPKSGSLWTKLMAYLIQHDGINDTVTEDMAQIVRFEFCSRANGQREEDVLQSHQSKPSPRLFTSHLPMDLLEKQVIQQKAKVVVMMRNPKDTIVSYFNHYTANEALCQFTMTWDEYFRHFQEKRLYGGDVLEFNLGWWEVRGLPNVCVLTYEQAKIDLEGTIRKLAKFLNKDLNDDTIKKIVELSSFKSVKNNPKITNAIGHRPDPNASNTLINQKKYLRKGEIGDWKNYFTKEQAKYVDNLCEKMLRPAGLVLKDSW